MNWSGSTDTTILLIVAYLGVCCAAFYAYFYKLFLGRFVKKLKDGYIYSAETAKDFTQLGYQGSLALVFLRRALAPNRSLRRYVTIVSPETDEKTATQAKFFLSEEKSEEALRRYQGKQSPLWAVVLVLIVFFVLLYLLSFVILPLFNMASKIPEQFQSHNEAGYSDEDTEKNTDEPTVPPEFEDFGNGSEDGVVGSEDNTKDKNSNETESADAKNGKTEVQNQTDNTTGGAKSAPTHEKE